MIFRLIGDVVENGLLGSIRPVSEYTVKDFADPDHVLERRSKVIRALMQKTDSCSLPYALNRHGRQLGLNIPAHSAEHTNSELLRYLVVMWSLAATTTSFSCCPDKSDFGGRHYLNSPIHFYEHHTTAWLPPSVPS